MSDPTTCERCGKPGRRRTGEVAPRGWLFGAFTFDSEGTHDPGDFLIVHACSPECRDALWTEQTDQRWDVIEARVNIRDELRRAGCQHANRLRAEAKRMREGAYPDGTDANIVAGIAFARLLETIAGELEESVENEIDAIAARDGNAGAGGA